MIRPTQWRFRSSPRYDDNPVMGSMMTLARTLPTATMVNGARPCPRSAGWSPFRGVEGGVPTRGRLCLDASPEPQVPVGYRTWCQGRRLWTHGAARTNPRPWALRTAAHSGWGGVW